MGAPPHHCERRLPATGWLDTLCAVVPIVALTRGAAGCDLFVGGARTRLPVEPVVCAAPTGAGDTFAASFALALARGTDPVAAARAGQEAARALVSRAAADAGRSEQPPV